MNRWVSVLALGLALGLAEATQAAPLTVADREAFTALSELAQVQAGAVAWPGFDPLRAPIALFDPGRVGFLFGLASPPRGFTQLGGLTPPLAGRMAARWGAVPELEQARGGLLTLSGQPVACLPLPYLTGEPGIQPRKLVAPMFGAFMARAFVGYPAGGTVRAAVRYPSAPPELRALAQLEGQILTVAVRQADRRQARSYARYLLAVRTERRRMLEADAIRFEDQLERFEGIPRYVEGVISAMGVTARQHAAPAVVWEREEVRQRALVARLRSELEPEAERRAHFTATGTALAMLLERLESPDWKRQVTGGASLSTVLARAVEFTPDEAPGLFQLARQNFGYEGLLAAARRVDARYPTSYQDFMRSGGTRVEIHGLTRVHEGEPAPGASEWLRLDAPLRPREVDRQTLLAPQLIEFNYRKGNVLVAIRRAPLLMQSRDLFWPFETVSYFDDEPTSLRIALDGRPWAWREGTFPFHVGLTMRGEHLSVAATRGTLQLKGRSLVLQLRK